MKIKTKLRRQGRICYKTGQEVGLWFELFCIGALIKSKIAKKENCEFEKGLLESYSQFTEAQYSREFPI